MYNKIVVESKIKSSLFLTMLIYWTISFGSFSFSQMKLQSTTLNNNSFIFYLTFNQSSELRGNGSSRIIKFMNSVDASKPGSPALPSKILYIAIPPESSAKISLINQKYQTYSNVSVEINPSVKKLNDSTLKYESQAINKKYFKTDNYPQNECKIKGYIWIRNYYCVVIEINPATYNWKLNQVKVLLNAELKVVYDNTVFPINKSNDGKYDRILKKVILNYDYATAFRTIRKSFDFSDSTGTWINYSNEYIKLAISSDGIYRINYQDLINYGLSPANIDPNSIKIYCRGKQLPLFINSNQPGTFSNDDFIEFWAQKNYGSKNYRQIVQEGTDYLNYLNRYTDTTYIWLTWDNQNGRRVEIDSSINLSSTDTISTYLDFQHFEDDVRLWYYDPVVPRVQLPFWQENKVWTWNVVGANGTIELPFQATNIVSKSTLKTYVRLISYAADIQNKAHKVGIGINSKSIIDSVEFNYKQTVNLFSASSADLLKEGENTLNIMDFPTDATFQQILLDWVDIEYERHISAVNDSLYFQFPDTLSKKVRVVKITDITAPNSDLILYKINPDTIKFTNFKVTGNINKTLTFIDTVSGGDRYIIISKEFIKSPKFETKKKFINLRNKVNGADNIIISNKELSSSAADYENFIKNNYDIRTKLIFVDDIYDEFFFGFPQPESIRNFLFYANQNWVSPAPSYLTLIGDANYDYKDKWTPVPVKRKQNLVPSYGFPVSDLWYCMWDSSQFEIPQMYIGRIPARDNEQVYFYLEKHKKYLNRSFDDWNKTFLFFSGGDPTISGQIEQLKSANNKIIDSYVKPKPIGGLSEHFYKTISPPTNFGPYTQAEIQSAIDKGGLFISYIGHSGTQTWDNGITDVNALKNSYDDRFPLISDFGCSTGKFAEPDVDCFGELFLIGTNNGQAISYLSNASWGYISTSTSYPYYFYEQLLRDSVSSIAEAHVLAKIEQFQQSGYSDVNRVFNYCNILFGDPLLDLKLPSKPNLKISPADIQLLKNNPSDQDDYLPIKIFYHNYGIVPDDSFRIAVKDLYNNKISTEQKYAVHVPLLNDSLIINILIKNKVGNHNLTVIIDSANTVDEIYKTDNQASITYIVYSVNFRSLFADQYYNSFKGNISFLNPTYNIDTSNNKYDIQIDTSRYFIMPIQSEEKLSNFSSSINPRGLISSKRYWWRVRLSNSSSWSTPVSFINVISNYQWFINSPIDSKNDINYVYTTYNRQDKAWKLSSNENELKVSSAGASDGKFASMQYNLLEELPSTYFWGVGTALIDTISLKPYGFKTFIYPNPPAGDSLLNYLQGLPGGTVLAMAICDDGAQSVLGFSGGTPVRNEIKHWGSKFIDSVGYRESWCMIGKKGAAIGSVPEVYKKLFQGIAVIDTTIVVQSDSGSILFPEISNSARWDSLHIGADVPSGSSLKIIPIGSQSNDILDTLSSLILNNGYTSLKSISAKKYPKIKFLVKLQSNELKYSPEIKYLEVKYKSSPELGTNYQVVSISKDSVRLGEDEKLQFYVYNVGESPADSFNVKVEVVSSDNIHSVIFNKLVDSLSPGSRKEFNIDYSALNGTGTKSFYIDIDPENKIPELYKDNNVFSIPFYVKADTSHPTLNVTFDGINILDGDYISSNPKIRIELIDNSAIPITDTSAMSILLNGNPVYYSSSQSAISYTFNTSNPKYVVIYTPILKDGEYNIKVTGKNSVGTLVDSNGYNKSFTVLGEPKLLNVYNYPNPFSKDTYFTFKLTQVPDELKIRIFTVAGRLVKEIIKHASDLNFDFNRIYWDGRDEDGDKLANGVYFYKITMTKGDKKDNVVQKIAIVR